MISLDEIRRNFSQCTSNEKKSALGQFFTPDAIANFMASLFSPERLIECSVLDPGAGIGSLTVALLNRFEGEQAAQTVASITAVELDTSVISKLNDTLKQFDKKDFSYEILNEDFLTLALNWIQFEPHRRFSHIIMNPPYKKISSTSIQRKLLHQAGIETVNLYAGFVALCIQLLKNDGELVAILPRSFCNGPYYKSFRQFLLRTTNICQIHLFGSRKYLFSDDNVLQENVILKLRREAPCEHEIKLSWATDLTQCDYTEYMVPSSEVVKPDDPEFFIRIPERLSQGNVLLAETLECSLATLDLSISTGPIVDFRVKQFLSPMPQDGTVPLIYPMHLHLTNCTWPMQSAKKSNSIFQNTTTQKMFFPAGYYCVVKRFSSKEEPRRITASVISPNNFQSAQYYGFENHLNVFHQARKGLQKELAYGLMVFLNSKVVDQYFRTFNGHTQVNATDLRQMHYPSKPQLEALGKWAQEQPVLTIEAMDKKVEASLCAHHATII